MRNFYWSKLLVLLLMLCLTAVSAAAQAERQSTIVVQASADVKVVPDEGS
jgi:uncharacterized protein YggE